MSVTIIRPAAKSNPAPLAVSAVSHEYNILDALAELKTHKGTLMLVHRHSNEAYQVLDYDQTTGRTKLKGQHGQLLQPFVTAREAALYTPLWR